MLLATTTVAAAAINNYYSYCSSSSGSDVGGVGGGGGGGSSSAYYVTNRPALPYRLRSSSSDDVIIPTTRLVTVGDRAFAVAGSRLWNSLPPDITSAQTLPVFCNRLKNRGVVVPERGGAPFRQIFFEPERRSGKYCLSLAER